MLQRFGSSESANFAIFGCQKKDKKNTTTRAFIFVVHADPDIFKANFCAFPMYLSNNSKYYKGT